MSGKLSYADDLQAIALHGFIGTRLGHCSRVVNDGRKRKIRSIERLSIDHGKDNREIEKENYYLALSCWCSRWITTVSQHLWSSAALVKILIHVPNTIYFLNSLTGIPQEETSLTYYL
jgi:hypothetical protein